MNSRILSQFISFIFHPMLISLVAFSLLIYGTNNTQQNAAIVLFTCFIFSNLIPIATVLILKQTGKISDLDASQKEQRIFPLMLGILYSGLGFATLTYLNAPNLISGLMFCYMTNTIVTILITRHWKVSIHAMGITGPLTALWVGGFQFPIVGLFIIFMVSYARVILKAHSILQVSIGALLGLVLTYFQLLLFFV